VSDHEKEPNWAELAYDYLTGAGKHENRALVYALLGIEQQLRWLREDLTNVEPASDQQAS
jgi:hypothetical protein